MYLGVDGGGTKTAFIIIDKSGIVLAEHEETTSYYIEIGLSGLSTLLINGVNEVLKKANLSTSDIDFSFFGLPAYGEDSLVIEEINAIPSKLFPVEKYACGNDMVSGWASALGCKDGINIVAGTGSIAYGELNGLKVRCGGWGEVFSDEGSAYWIAKSGLETFTKMSDGRLDKGPLYQLIKSHLNLKVDFDVCGLVLNQWQSSRSKISQLSVVVAKAALAGDKSALMIFDRAARELALIIESTKKQLKYKKGEEVIISYSGGVFNAKELIMVPLTKYLSETCGKFSLVKPKYKPVTGSALYAAKLHGFKFPFKALALLKDN
ncbi:MAG: BadF/BadG/BcrA/BcrD ATPase family protein [Nonlabens ulvanivorans]|uniref:N-acetylglucosamine kinase n=1 Tax=Nonlabens ulvanivorans TaxID=906888 RepID=UPI003266BDFB